MSPELFGLLIGAIFWIVTVALFVAWLISRADARASLDDGDPGASWADEGAFQNHNDLPNSTGAQRDHG